MSRCSRAAVHAEGALQGIGKDAGEGSDDGTEPDETAGHAGDKDVLWSCREQAIPQAAGGGAHGKAGDGRLLGNRAGEHRPE